MTTDSEALLARVRRTMTDHGRMLWRDDVEGHCDTPDICFEYGDSVRCGPCAIRQADAAGVETMRRDQSYLPEVCRLNREIAALRAQITLATHRERAMSDSTERAAVVRTKAEARRWVRAHWADMIIQSDMGAVADLDDPLLEDVWNDECRKIAARMTRGDHIKGDSDHE